MCRYDVPEPGQPVDLAASVVGPAGIGRTPIGGSLAVLERWRLVGDRLERQQLDDRRVEYPRMDQTCEGQAFRYGYAVELVATPGTSRSTSRSGSISGSGLGSGSGSGSGFDGSAPGSSDDDDRALVHPAGLLKFDLDRDEVASWSPAEGGRVSEPIFVRSVEGHSDEEGWLLTVVDDPDRGASDLYVLDASSFGRRSPEAVIHLPDAAAVPEPRGMGAGRPLSLRNRPAPRRVVASRALAGASHSRQVSAAVGSSSVQDCVFRPASAGAVVCRMRSAKVVTSTRVHAVVDRHSIGGPRGWLRTFIAFSPAVLAICACICFHSNSNASTKEVHT